MADLFQKLKRKSRKSSSTSSEEDNRPSEDKRSKFDLSEEDCGIDEVHSVLEMAEDLLPKLDIVLKKLEAMETKLDNLESYVKNVDAKVSALTVKVETLEATTRNAMKSIEELDRGLAFLNNEVEELKKPGKTALLSDKKFSTWEFTKGGKTFVSMVSKKTLRAQKTRGKS